MSYSLQPILILTGMHRSGTSLASSLLQSAGVNIGKKLVPANDGNPKGYFENADFVDFHEKVLFSLGIDKIGWTTQEKIIPPLEFLHEAKKLIEVNQDFDYTWGWKEPRTSLLVDFWCDLLPSAYFIFVYRRPWEVIDSLYRRGDDIFRNHPFFALDVWSSYNRALVNFYTRHQEKCLLINLQKITENPFSLVEMINDKFNLSFANVDANLYDPDFLKTEGKKSQRPHLIKNYFPDIWQQYQQLNSLTNYNDFSLEDVEKIPLNTWLLQDWQNVRFLDKTLKQEKKYSDAHLHSVYQELGEVKGQKEAMEFNLHQKQKELEENKYQFDYLQKELEENKHHLYQSQQNLEEILLLLNNSQKQLKLTEFELELAKNEINNNYTRIQNFQADLDYYKNEIFAIQSDRQQCQLEYDKLHIVSVNSYEDLIKTKEILRQKEENINSLIKQIEELKQIISGMESSKFWSVREKWFSLKRGLKLNDDK